MNLAKEEGFVRLHLNEPIRALFVLMSNTRWFERLDVEGIMFLSFVHKRDAPIR